MSVSSQQSDQKRSLDVRRRRRPQTRPIRGDNRFGRAAPGFSERGTARGEGETEEDEKKKKRREKNARALGRDVFGYAHEIRARPVYSGAYEPGRRPRRAAHRQGRAARPGVQSICIRQPPAPNCRINFRVYAFFFSPLFFPPPLFFFYIFFFYSLPVFHIYIYIIYTYIDTCIYIYISFFSPPVSL